jgi:hypothetical protein
MLFHANARLVDPGRFEELLPAESAAAVLLAGEGLVTQTLLRANRDGFFITVEAADADAAARVLDRLPFVSKGVVSIVELVEVRVI